MATYHFVVRGEIEAQDQRTVERALEGMLVFRGARGVTVDVLEVHGSYPVDQEGDPEQDARTVIVCPDCGNVYSIRDNLDRR